MKSNWFVKITVLIRLSVVATLSSVAVIGHTETTASEAKTTISHAIAMHGEPKYKEGFSHFEYANPDAPKGGSLTLATVSSAGFDSLNPFVAKGVSVAGMSYLHRSLFYDTLTVNSGDEAFTPYGLIAERMEIPEDRSWIIFHLNPAAKFHDNHTISSEDVVFSFETFVEKGHPLYSSYFGNVENVDALDEHKVKFTFKPGDNRELALILGELPIIPKHYWQDRDFTASSLEAPVGSGPYMIKNVDAGRSITYQRNPDYWGKDTPVNKGMYNFDEVSYQYYRDSTVIVEALKAGEFDYRSENTAKIWATAYEGPLFDNKLMIKKLIPTFMPEPMQGFIYNTRNSLFKNREVRKALAYAFDFEWTNKNIFYNSYTRSNSFFSSSELAATGLPSEDELKVLNQYKEKIPEEIFTQEYKAPVTDGSGNNRANMRIAKNLLVAEGWEVKNNILTHKETGEEFRFEILIATDSMERLIQPFIQNIKRLGIEVDLRLIDTLQYVNRVQSHEFDMVVTGFGQSLSPGNEQRDMWHSSQTDVKGSRNYIGISDPVIDEVIELIISSNTREELVTNTKILDRLLLWGHYLIPHYYIAADRAIYWDKFSQPEITAKYKPDIMSWWYDEEKAQRVKLEKLK